MARNTAFLTVASVGQKAIAFVYFLFLARVMMPELTGEYFLAVSITVMFTVMADMGLTPVVIREVAKDPGKAARIMSRAMAFKLPLIVLSVLCAVAASRALGYSADIQSLVALATSVLALDALHLLFYGVLRGFQRLRYESLGVFAGQACTGAAGALVLWLQPSLSLLVVALVAGSLVNVAISGSKIISTIGWRALVPRWHKGDSWQMARSAVPFALASIFVKVYSYIDSILISKMIGTAAVGVYSIAYKLTYSFQFLPLAFVAALYPGMSAAVAKDSAGLNGSFLRSMWYMAILSTPITLGIIALSDEVVLMAGERYAAAAPVLSVLVCVLIPIFLDFPIGSLLNASNRQTTKTVIMGATMVVNVALNLLLIPKFGIIGAAYAAVACFTFMFFAGLWFVPKILPAFQLSGLVRSILPIWASGLAMFAVVVLVKPYAGWLLSIPLGACVYVLCLVVMRAVRRSDVRALADAVSQRV